jgi:hypothetical protein
MVQRSEGTVNKEQVSFDDKVVITPVELYRDPELNGECYALFGVMKSFGPFAMAKVSSYGARLGWSDDRVQKYQKQLRAAGWIVLVREGYDATPRLWWMCRVKNEQPPQDLVDRVGKKQGVQKPPPVKTTPRKKQGVQNTAPKQKKALQSVEGLKDQSKREKVKANSEKPKTSLSSASPTPGQEALALMNPVYRAKHGVDLHPNYAPQAAEAQRVYGADLVPAWTRFVADPGTRGRMDEFRHPIPIFTAQPNLWATPPAAPGADPAKVEAAQAAAARARADREARLQAERAAAERLATAWPRLPAQLRDQVLDQVAALNDFMADFVKACRQRRGGMFEAHSAVCHAVLELRPDLGGAHG